MIFKMCIRDRKRIAPLGDPVIVNFRGFDLAIRKKDAKNIFVHK